MNRAFKFILHDCNSVVLLCDPFSYTKKKKKNSKNCFAIKWPLVASGQTCPKKKKKQ